MSVPPCVCPFFSSLCLSVSSVLVLFLILAPGSCLALGQRRKRASPGLPIACSERSALRLSVPFPFFSPLFLSVSSAFGSFSHSGSPLVSGFLGRRKKRASSDSPPPCFRSVSIGMPVSAFPFVVLFHSVTLHEVNEIWSPFTCDARFAISPFRFHCMPFSSGSVACPPLPLLCLPLVSGPAVLWLSNCAKSERGSVHQLLEVSVRPASVPLRFCPSLLSSFPLLCSAPFGFSLVLALTHCTTEQLLRHKPACG